MNQEYPDFRTWLKLNNDDLTDEQIDLFQKMTAIGQAYELHKAVYQFAWALWEQLRPVAIQLAAFIEEYEKLQKG